MKVAVLGGNGQLGTDVVRAFAENGDEVLPLTHADIEIADLASVRRRLEKTSAGKSSSIHRRCIMSRIANSSPRRHYAVNGAGSAGISQWWRVTWVPCSSTSALTTFLMASKRSPYEETDCPRPLNVYGNTKLAGEYFVRCGAGEAFRRAHLRPLWKIPCRAKGGRNFVDLMLKLAKERGEVRVVDDEWVSPTSTRELARQIVVLSRSDAYGLYHATAEGACSWYRICPRNI